MKKSIKILSLLMVVLLGGFAVSQGNLYKKHNKPGIAYWHGDLSKPRVALTFDDGPNEPYTSQILEILKKENVRATFFMVGKNVDTYPEAARKVAQDGHVIGNHSYSHRNLILETDGKVRREIKLAEDSILKATGVRPTLFRPPFGADDPLTFHQTEKMGYVVVKWSVSAKDWREPGTAKILGNVLNHIDNGAIILLHDGDKLFHGHDR